MKWLSSLIISIVLLSSMMVSAQTEPHRRLVNFEWEEIANAKSYELLIRTEKNILGENNEFKFIVDTPAWNGKLSPGSYTMKLRSLDHRKVPGKWSEESQFNVALDTVSLVSPVPAMKVTSDSDKEETLEFVWNPVAGADFYSFELISEDKTVDIKKTVTEAKLNLEAPVAKNYTWKVTAHNKNDIHSDATSVGNFQIMGKNLQAATITRPENAFVRELVWTPTEHAEGYDLLLVKFNPTTKKWQKVAALKKHPDAKYTFPSENTGGLYQLQVTPVSPMRGNAKPQKIAFEVADGDRSPASEYRTLIRQSIDRTNGWFALASYMVTNIDYSGENLELNSNVRYSALGGTLRLGGGFISPKENKGFNAILDVSGFNFEGSVKNYFGAEANGIYRRAVGTQGEFRAFTGPYYREIPETISQNFSSFTQDFKIKLLGLHAGSEYWHSFSPKFGVQANLHFYVPMAKIDVPNGSDIDNSLSFSAGFMGSYRLNKNTAILPGYTFKKDTISYRSRTGSSSYATDGGKNSSTVEGHYLNLYVERSF